MTTHKQQLQADLTTAMRARDTVRRDTVRMALAAVREAEVAGTEARELSDDEVEKVLTREVRKRREAATAFADAGRAEQAAAERAEIEVLAAYLPAQLDDAELRALVAEVLATEGLSGRGSIGAAMKAVNARVAGRAEGGRVSAEVKQQLG